MLATEVKCDACGGHATVHMTVNEHGRAVEEHLCEGCCERKYGASFPNSPLREYPEERVVMKGGTHLIHWPGSGDHAVGNQL
jgi:protein-arginine kinase activator protein McsA